MTRATLTPVAKFDDRPGFNAHAANVVYKAMSEMDEESALVFGRILVAEGLHYDLIAHGDEIIKAAESAVSGRADALRRRFSSTAVAKARAGQDTSYEIQCLAALSKAFDPEAFSTQQRSQWARDQKRSSEGRFVTDHTQVHTDGGRPAMSHGAAAKMTGAPRVNNMSDADLSHYQQAYGQIRDILAPYRNPALNAALHLNVENRAGRERTEVLDVKNGQPHQVGEMLNPGDRIKSAAVSVHPEGRSSVGAGFDAVSALTGSSRAGSAAAGVGVAAAPDNLRSYNDKGAKYKGNDAYSGTTRAFNRVADASGILQDSLGDVAPKKLQYALAVANHVGQFGPEAQKVIGPTADRTAYRYRGTERVPSRRLEAAFIRLRRDSAITNGTQYREAAIGGIEREEGWDSGPVLSYFHDHLPNPDLNELQRKSGVIPPSEGIIINAQGKVAHQSTGFADDWYLPFNLKHLAGLKGGQYIRTRSFGGPTTEDIYTGLMSGARSMTVVSHNGVYTVDFDRNLRGGRRFNDKATRMVGRYGNLLDAVRAGKVSTGGDISRSRKNEIRERALAIEPDDTSAQHKELVRRMEADERSNPKLSQFEKDKAAGEWLDLTASKMNTRDGRTMRGDQLAGETLDRRSKEMFLADKEVAARWNGPPLKSQQEYREGLEATWKAQPNREAQVAFLAGEMGTKRADDFGAFMQRTDTANRDRLHPLALNGRGYHSALLALQEQFPYYIADVRYHEWNTEIGRGEADTYENRRDTGYVLPKHNRPADAMAGYFDDRVNGTGKVRADSIRFQNRRANPELASPDTTKLTSGAEPSSGSVGGGGVGSAAPDAQRAADLALMKELRAQTRFAPGAKLRGQDRNGQEGPLDFGGGVIKDEIADDRFPNDAIKFFYRKTPAELEALPPENLSALLNDVVGAGNKVFAVNTRTVDMFQNGGKATAAKERPADPAARLDELDVDHAFPGEGPVYDVQRNPPPPEQIRAEYEGNPGLKALSRTHALPAIDVEDREFAAHVDRIRGALADRGLELNRLRNAGSGPMIDETTKLENDTDALMRATQLRRRFKQAQLAHPPQAPDVQNQVAFVNMGNDPQGLDAMLRNIGVHNPQIEQ